MLVRLVLCALVLSTAAGAGALHSRQPRNHSAAAAAAGCAPGRTPATPARVGRSRAGPAAAPDAALHRPVSGAEPLANHSAAWLEASSEYWMEEIFIEYWKRQEKYHEAVDENLFTVYDDLFLIFTTMLLPAGAFCAFFLYVTFCTSSPIKVPYTNIDGPGIKTPWMSYSHGDKSVKCYPTYGEV